MPRPLSPEETLEQRLHAAIPLAAYLGVRVLTATPLEVRLAAPLAPSINHLATVFGGSAVAVATLAAWSLLDLKLQQAQLPAAVVIQHSSMHHERPIKTDFQALARWSGEAGERAWARFAHTLQRRGRARLTLAAQLLAAGERRAAFEGGFVALAP